MKQFSYKIKDKDGVHARPAGAILKAVSGYKSDIYLESRGHKISLKAGIFALMGMGIRYDDEVIITCEGTDEEAAAVAVKDAFADNL